MSSSVVLKDKYQPVLLRSVSLLYKQLKVDLEVLEMLIEGKYVSDLLFFMVPPNISSLSTKDELESEAVKIKLEMHIIENICTDLGYL